MRDSYEDIIVSLEGNVGLIEINRPPHNFFDHSLIRQIADALDEFDQHVPCRSVVLAAKGKSFCAGAQFSQESNGEARYELGSPAPLYVEAVRLLCPRLGTFLFCAGTHSGEQPGKRR